MDHSILLCGSMLKHKLFLTKGYAQKTLGSTTSSILDKVGCCVIYDMVPEGLLCHI